MKKIIIFLFLLVLIGVNVAAAETKYSFPFLQVSSEADYNLGYFIGKFYQWSLGLASLAALISIIIAGIRITTSAGNVSMVDDARDQITQAILGLALLFGAYLVLHTIDPGLTSLKDPHFEEKITLRSGEKYYKSLGKSSSEVELAKELSKIRQQAEEEYKNTSLGDLSQEEADLREKMQKISQEMQGIKGTRTRDYSRKTKLWGEYRKSLEKIKVVKKYKKTRESNQENNPEEFLERERKKYQEWRTKYDKGKINKGKFEWLKLEADPRGGRIVPQNSDTIDPNKAYLCGTPSPGPGYYCVLSK